MLGEIELALHIQTPSIASNIGKIAGRSVFLKLDLLQPSGSFKLRGIGHFCETKLAQGSKRFVSSSGGNAGLAVAYAGATLGVPVLVYVPETTSARAIGLIREAGAELKVVGANWAQAHRAALDNLQVSDTYVHPFDHPLLWEGHASLVDELVQQTAKPDAIVCSVGGGGLLSGVIEGLHRNGWTDVPVVAVETKGAACYAEAIQHGHPVELTHISTVASSLAAPTVCEQAFKYAKEHNIISLVIEDSEAVKGSLALLDQHRLLTEPACGASIAALWSGLEVLEKAKTVVVVACGGVGATAEQLLEWSAKLAA